MLKSKFLVCSWIGNGISQIKLTEYQTMPSWEAVKLGSKDRVYL